MVALRIVCAGTAALLKSSLLRLCCIGLTVLIRTPIVVKLPFMRSTSNLVLVLMMTRE